MILIDSHAHIDLFEDIDRVITRAKDANIKAILAMGTNLKSNIKTITIAKRYPQYIFPCLGIHPHEIHKIDVHQTLTHISENAENCIAIGEIGLDYSHNSINSKKVREEQREIFVELLKISKKYSKPVSIHSRSAYNDSLILLLEYGPKEAVFHWYDGPLHILERILDSGFFISATPAAVYSKGMRAVLNRVPLDKIILETDSPVYLKNNNRMSEPADLKITLKAFAEIRGIPMEYIANVTTKNTKKLFHLS